jgi:hypothetical protein
VVVVENDQLGKFVVEHFQKYYNNTKHLQDLPAEFVVVDVTMVVSKKDLLSSTEYWEEDSVVLDHSRLYHQQDFLIKQHSEHHHLNLILA